MRTYLFLAGLLAVLSCGGGRPADRSLFSIDGGTTTVEQAGEMWNTMPSEFRRVILSSDSVQREFARTIAARNMIELEVSRLGIDTLPEIISAGRAAGRMRSLAALHRLLREEASSRVSPEDVDLYLDRMGRTVWYTVSDGENIRSAGPEHLPETEPALSSLLASMSPGDTAILDHGRTLILDSLLATDPDLVEETAGIEGYRDLARDRLVNAWTDRSMERLEEEFLGYPAPVPDSAVIASVAGYFSSGSPYRAADTVAAAGGFALTAGDLAGSVKIEGARIPVSPESETWLTAFSIALIRRQAAAAYLAENHPREYAEAFAEADSVSMSAAADLLYSRFVTDSVMVTEDDIQELYARLQGELTVPERRSVLSVQLEDREEAERFREAVSSGTAGLIADEFPWVPSISSSHNGGRLSRPLTMEEVPAGLGPRLFSLAREDTVTWLGPEPYAQGLSWVALRLADVHPQHPAELEEVRETLEDMTAAGMEAERYAEWISELHARWRAEFNWELIDSLPPDPAAWADGGGGQAGN